MASVVGLGHLKHLLQSYPPPHPAAMFPAFVYRVKSLVKKRPLQRGDSIMKLSTREESAPESGDVGLRLGIQTE